MKILFYSSRSYDRESFQPLLDKAGFEYTFVESRLKPETAILAEPYDAICLFVNDRANEETLRLLAMGKTRFILLRSAGFNHVQLDIAMELGIRVARVPAYSPQGVAEHTLALLLAINRKIHRAYNRVREGNFSLEGLVGFNLYQKTVGVIGTGKIGAQVCRILSGFGCKVLAHDPYPVEELTELGVEYHPLEILLENAHILTLHCPLTPDTHHLIDRAALEKTRPGLILINTSRGGLLDTQAVIQLLKTNHIGGLALDVYEEEEALFFDDLSGTIIQDDVFVRLISFPQVLVTGHQAFLTKEALHNIAETTVENLQHFASPKIGPNELPLK